MEKVCRSFYSFHIDGKTYKKRPIIGIVGLRIVITVITVIAFDCTYPECFVSNLKIYPDQIRPQASGQV